jgi:hypothetical protein
VVVRVDQYHKHSARVFALSDILDVAGLDSDLYGLSPTSLELSSLLQLGPQCAAIGIDSVAGADQQFIAGFCAIGGLVI